MRERQLPLVFWLFVTATIVQPVAFYLSGSITNWNTRGIAFLAILVVLLARRSRVAWGLLILMDGIPTLAVLLASVSGGSMAWEHVVAAVMTGTALMVLLLSRGMRQFVARRESPLVAH